MSNISGDFPNGRANALLHETSPYLLQHAYNPVNWQPWGNKALQEAKELDKPILVSIGYSACHWCHVMERECFEDIDIASIMNQYFINIKVDREERPDVDQVYMDALQMMNLKGGWPLNVFLTPDAKPFYGGTYFPPSHWSNLLSQISEAFKNKREDLEISAEQFTTSLNQSEIEKYGLLTVEKEFTLQDLSEGFEKMSKNFDSKWGGMNREPKFPMPSIYLFLLRFYKLSKNEKALSHLQLSLSKIAMGGIYDQAGGGFSRYSTDKEWLVPHFEKMLYDNGQLLSLFSEALVVLKDPLFQEIIIGTIEWVKREMTNEEGGFYSALDADSEGEEGKFYVWTTKEIEELFEEDFNLFSEYYDLQPEGNWEHGKNILNRKWSDLAFANKNNLEEEKLQLKIKTWKETLLNNRGKRIRPGLDDKILTSWNCILLQGIIDAYKATGKADFLDLALCNARFISSKMIFGKEVFHTYKNGNHGVKGFLEDYAFIIQSFISLYQEIFEEEWLLKANELTEYTIKYFYDEKEFMFFFNSLDGEQLIARKKEIFDNVIPSSNSVMANNLLKLGHLFDSEEYIDIASNMAGRIKKMLPLEMGFLANWASLVSNIISPMVEVAIVGPDFVRVKQQFNSEFLPNVVFSGTTTGSNLPLLADKITELDKKETKIYVCYNKSCQRPTTSVKEALLLINKAAYNYL